MIPAAALHARKPAFSAGPGRRPAPWRARRPRRPRPLAIPGGGWRNRLSLIHSPAFSPLFDQLPATIAARRGRATEARRPAHGGDHMRAHLAADWPLPEPRGDRARHRLGHRLKPAGPPLLDLVAQRRALTEADREIARRRQSALSLDGLDCDVTEPDPGERLADDVGPVMPIGCPGEKQRWI